MQVSLQIARCPVQRLVVEEIIGKAESGITEPYLCRLSDGKTYYVKGTSATIRGLINELVCALLGRALGLPIPPVALAEVTSATTQFDPSARASLGAGLAFASEKHDSLVEATSANLHRLDLRMQQKLFLFDYWVRNEDRTFTEFGGNPNLFIDVETETAIVIDHNLAFDPAFDLRNNRLYHICRQAWIEASSDILLPAQLRAELMEVNSMVPAILSELPDEWIGVSPGSPNQIADTLKECLDDAFWEKLSG